MLSAVGDPHLRFQTVHVTGSSGKGSTAAMVASILQAAGYVTGSFSSPHLEEYTERIAVGGEPIDGGDWTRLLNHLRPTVEAMAGGTLPGYSLGRPALLQVLWPMAALYFAERGVQVAVVEVGMGGRYDSTRANNARVAVLTNVSLEHTQLLGPGIADIAFHKAGVAPSGGILVTAARHPEALPVIRAECERVGAALWCVSGDAETEVRYAGDEGNLEITTPLRRHRGLRLALLGRHQRANAACAVAAVAALQMLGVVHVAPEAIRRGLLQTMIAGRLERAGDHPVTYLDGAHNPDAARALATALGDLFPGGRIVLMLGILGDKDIAAMVEALAPLAAALIVTEPPWAGRMGHGAEVAAAARAYLNEVSLEPDVGKALDQARARAQALDSPLVVAGSLILVGAVRHLLRDA
jgi:dihydrofolate synthase/folylpolyglutamate synthase